MRSYYYYYTSHLFRVFRATTGDYGRVDLDTLHLLVGSEPLRAVGGNHPSGQGGQPQPSLLRVTHSQGPDASVLCRPVTCATCATPWFRVGTEDYR